MTTIALSRTSVARRREAGKPRHSLRDFVARAWRNFTTRRQLSDIDDRMLQDLGISRAQAHFEVNKPIWR